MKAWWAVFQFIGSFRFSIVLFAAFILTVAAGSLIESSTQSHESASHFIYHHPFFFILLAALFLNLFFAIFRKWPLKLQHSPFLLAHIGLMMVIAGAFADAILGFNGILVLSDGQPQRCIIPGTYALTIESAYVKEEPPLFIDLKQSLLKGNEPREMRLPLFSSKEMRATLVRYLPHANEKLKCFSEDQTTLFLPGSMAIPVALQPSRKIHWGPMKINEETWKVAGIKSKDVGETAAELSLNHRKEDARLLALIEDESREEYLLMIGREGDVAMSSIESLVKNALVTFNNGWQGYGIQGKLPREIKGEDECESVFIKIHPSPKSQPIPATIEERTPCLYVDFHEDGHSDVLPLTYDPSASSFRWPVLGGKYLVRFQPIVHALPHTLRHKKWECSHSQLFAHSEKCRCKLILVEKSKVEREISLGYNAAHSAGGGYQYTLMKNPLRESDIHIGVQYSIAKKILIYPGILCTGLGILCLYLRKIVSVKCDPDRPHAISFARFRLRREA